MAVTVSVLLWVIKSLCKILYQIPLARELGNGDSLKRIIRSAFTCAIWTAYLLKSERVHNTFVK
ncbi:DUF2569 family protein [Paenibacillus odorifer]|uniref:DUF2569 family protein n=1 Tax=Paenibacillus TaxID=44249 RepID=UPI0009D63D59